MSTLHFTQTTTSTPAQFVAGLTLGDDAPGLEQLQANLLGSPEFFQRAPRARHAPK